MDLKEDSFHRDMQNRFSVESVEQYTSSEIIFLYTLNNHALLKKNMFAQIMPKGSHHETVILGKSVLPKKNSKLIKKNKKKKRITAADFTKKSGENISKVFIQVGSVKT